MKKSWFNLFCTYSKHNHTCTVLHTWILFSSNSNKISY